jgi:hypothetical protein
VRTDPSSVIDVAGGRQLIQQVGIIDATADDRRASVVFPAPASPMMTMPQVPG